MSRRRLFVLISILSSLILFALEAATLKLTISGGQVNALQTMNADPMISDVMNGVWELSDTPWPTHAYDFQRTSRSPYIGITRTHVIETWSRTVPQARTITTGLSGTLFIKSSGETQILDLDTHQVVGQLSGGGCRSMPTQMANGNIYYGDEFDTVAYSGFETLLWTFNHGLGCQQISLLVDPDGTIYFPHGQLLISADAQSGTINWTIPLSVHGAGGMALGHDGTIYVNTRSALFAINPEGTLQWQILPRRRTMTPSIADDGTIYSAGENELSAVNPDGTLKWEFPILGDVCNYNSMAIGQDGTIYFPTTRDLTTSGDAEAHFYAINPDGTLKWQFVQIFAQGDAGFCGSPVVDRLNNSYVCDDNSYCYGFDENGSLMWSHFVEANSSLRAQPVILEDGIMYIAAILKVSRVEGIYLDETLFIPIATDDLQGN